MKSGKCKIFREIKKKHLRLTTLYKNNVPNCEIARVITRKIRSECFTFSPLITSFHAKWVLVTAAWCILICEWRGPPEMEGSREK
jgi:hypothetical protein